MDKKTEKNNLNNEKNIIAADPGNTVKKRGRPKGSKNSIKTTRQDKTIQTLPGENTKYLTHDLKLFRLPKIDLNNTEQLKQRIDEYFSISAADDIKPSIASFSLSLGINRFDLFNYINGRSNVIKNHECILTLKSAYDLINSYYEHMMNTGKINPVAGIFLMKNNLGYKDNTEYTINTNQERQETITDITSRANLLD